MKYFRILLLVMVAGISIWAAQFYSKNLRGIGPALKSPPQNIAEVINTTGMPLKLPPGFSISIFAKDLGKPRVMMFDSSGVLLVSIPSAGKVVALPDKNKDGVADEIVTVVSGLNRPHGLEFFCDEGGECSLMVAESDQVSVFSYQGFEGEKNNLPLTGKSKMIDLPGSGEHVTRSLLLLDNFHLLVSVGSSCNACVEKDWRRAKILVASPLSYDEPKIFASGLRNAVFMTLHPNTGEVWATEMGRDFLGDDLPPDEINMVREGRHYGWPFFYGKNVPDQDFRPSVKLDAPPQTPTTSAIDIPAHSAPLGLAFIPHNWPEEYRDDLLVAYHGSWNRSVPTGYKVVRHKFDVQGNYGGEEDFILGWLTKEGALGRPVDILIDNFSDQQNAVMYLSDDKAGVVYRVEYTRERQ